MSDARIPRPDVAADKADLLSVSVVIATFRRPGPLLLAARSVLAQEGIVPGDIELIIVDNDPAGSAAPVFDELVRQASIKTHLVHVREPGVARARNAGVAAARGEFIVFLDDDEEAPPTWLAALLRIQAETSADVVFGPVRASLPDGVHEHREYLERFFSRSGPDVSGPLDLYYGCGNSLLRRSALPDPLAPFSTSRDHTGGEDDLLFGAMQQGSARFAWAHEAWVLEHVPVDRARLGYALRRAFAYGQGPAEAAHAEGRWGAILRWMAIGAIQAAAYGVQAALQWLFRTPDRADALDRTMRGLGKLFWFRSQEFYGRAALGTGRETS